MTDAIRAPADPEYFEDILEHLYQSRGFDFTAYKRTTLMRRVQRRMHTVSVASFEAYLDYLQLHQDEFHALFNTILINVTSFFRDRDVWNYIAETTVPTLLSQRREGLVRIWSAGCAGGHEPYTLAMILAQYVGGPSLRDRVKIYATDVDDEALNEARAGVYSSRQVSDVPPDLAAKYFEQTGSQFTVTGDLRRSVVFGRHDLIQDAPISRVDLLVCRNTLMYFQSDAQSRILARFFYSINPGGYLLLGRAEMLFSHFATFTPADLKRRVFRPVPAPSKRDRLLLFAQTGRDVMSNDVAEQMRMLKEAAFESDSTPCLVIDLSGTLVGANAAARRIFDIQNGDAGRPLQELEVWSRPVELRPAIRRALEQGTEVTLTEVGWPLDIASRFFDIVVTPLLDDERKPFGTRVTFTDVSEVRLLRRQLQQSKQELETAYEELQSTNEELETTNEELQSTVEELETTNEELQSTNEELETMNEELQSTNEELQTMNEEFRNRSMDVTSANSFLESVFASLQSAVIVLDRQFAIQVWNERAVDLWGLRPGEVLGSNFLNLEIGLPVAELRSVVREALVGEKTPAALVLAATNRRGKPIHCRVSVAPLRDADRPVHGVILLMDDVGETNEQRSQL